MATLPGGIVATLTLLGEAAGPRVLTRSGARRGDLICVTGPLGGSLNSGRHFRFTPRLLEGQWLAARAEVRSMMDLSDGLAKDLRALTPRACEAELDPARLPRNRGCDLRAALCDGEDYELVFTLAADTDFAFFANEYKRAFPRGSLHHLGCFKACGTCVPGSVNLSAYQGFEHLQD